ncbi:hypothetical protein QJQ45_022622, partial [Haematococcus lacustris]
DVQTVKLTFLDEGSVGALNPPPPTPPLLAAPVRPSPPPASVPPSPEAIGSQTSLRITFFGLDLWSLCTWQSIIQARVEARQPSSNLTMQFLTAPGMCYSRLRALNYTELLDTTLTADQLMPGLAYFVDDVTRVLREYLIDKALSVRVFDFCAGNRTKATFFTHNPTMPVNGTWATLQVVVTVSSPSPQGGPGSSIDVVPPSCRLPDAHPALPSGTGACAAYLLSHASFARTSTALPATPACPSPPAPTITIASTPPASSTHPASYTTPSQPTTTEPSPKPCPSQPSQPSSQPSTATYKQQPPASSASGEGLGSRDEAGSSAPVWLDTALEDLRIGSEVECLRPVGKAGVDAFGAATNTAYQLGACHVVYYTHAVRAALNLTRLTFTRADGSSGQLAATPCHRYFLPGHPLPLPPPHPSCPAPSNSTREAAQGEAAAQSAPLSPTEVAHVPGGWKYFGAVTVGDLVLLRDAGSGRLHTTTITAVETVLEYGSFNPVLQGHALLLPEGVAAYNVLRTAYQLGLAPYDAAFSHRLTPAATDAERAAPQPQQQLRSALTSAASPAIPVVRAHIRMPADDGLEGVAEAQLSHLTAQTCPERLPGFTFPPAASAFTVPLSRLEQQSAAGGTLLLDMATHVSAPPHRPATSGQVWPQPQLACPSTAPSLQQQSGGVRGRAAAGADLLPLWRHCLEHWAVNASLSRSWQRSSPPLALQLARASSGQLPLVTLPVAPDAYLDMASIPGPMQPAVRQLLSSCVQLGSRMGDLPFVSSAAAVFQTLLDHPGAGGLAALSSLSVQQQASATAVSLLDVLALFMQSMPI